MSLISSCTTLASTDRELAAYQSEIDSVCSEFTSALQAITSSDEAVQANKLADDAFAAANTLFRGNVDQVLSGAGLLSREPNFSESWRRMLDSGYLFAGSRAYFACTETWKLPHPRGNSVYRYVGVEDGEYSTEMLRTLIRNYVEPDYETVIRNLHEQVQTVTGSLTAANPSAIGPENNGNVAFLRELYIGCGSQKQVLSAFLVDMRKQKHGVVWSIPTAVSVLRPNNITVAAFTPDKARSLCSATVREDDVIRLSDDEYIVLIEQHIGYNITRAEAYAKGLAAGAFDSSFDQKNLVCRIATGSTNDDLRNGAPLFVSQGFDGTKLGPTSHLLGVMVQGIARVVDITADGGMNVATDAYTAASVARTIQNTFPDLVEAGAVGDEWYVTLKTTGPDAVLAFFVVDSNDASTASGVTRKFANDYGIVFDSSNTSLLEIPGGVAAPAGIPASLLKRIAGYALPDIQRAACIGDSSSYWTQIAPDLDALFTNVRNALPDAVDHASVNSMFPLVAFTFVEDLRIEESQCIIASLGSEFDNVMRNTKVLVLDTYTGRDVVYNTLKQDLVDLQSGTGFVQNPAQNQQITQTPRAINYKQCSSLFLYAAGIQTTADRNPDVASGLQITLTDAVDSAVTATESKSYIVTLTRVFTSLGQQADDYTAIINQMPESLQGIVSDTLSAVDAQVTSFMRKNFPEEYRKFTNAVDDVRSWFSDASDTVNDDLSLAYGMVKDVQNLLASAESFGVRQLRKVSMILTAATPMITSYANAYQSTYRKLAALTNMNANLFKTVGTGFSTQLVTCHVEGDASVELFVYLEKYLNLLNAGATALNTLLQSAIAAVKKLRMKLDCMVAGVKSAVAGDMSYTTTAPFGGAVGLAVTCSTSTNVDVSVQLLVEITKIADQIDALLRLFDVHLATYTAQTTCNDSMTKQTTSALLLKYELSLDNMSKCLRA